MSKKVYNISVEDLFCGAAHAINDGHSKEEVREALKSACFDRFFEGDVVRKGAVSKTVDAIDRSQHIWFEFIPWCLKNKLIKKMW